MSSRRGTKFYQSEDFKKLNEAWAKKLQKSGFEDHEYANGTLKTKNTRTQAYRQQSELSRISSALISYIENPKIKLQFFERRILELHAAGVYQKQIIRRTKKSHTTVWKTLKIHIPLALGLYSKEERELELDTLP